MLSPNFMIALCFYISSLDKRCFSFAETSFYLPEKSRQQLAAFFHSKMVFLKINHFKIHQFAFLHFK